MNYNSLQLCHILFMLVTIVLNKKINFLLAKECNVFIFVASSNKDLSLNWYLLILNLC